MAHGFSAPNVKQRASGKINQCKKRDTLCVARLLAKLCKKRDTRAFRGASSCLPLLLLGTQQARLMASRHPTRRDYPVGTKYPIAI